MERLGAGSSWAIAGFVLAILLVILDKVGKLKGPMLLCLLLVAALMTLPLALSNPLVAGTDGAWKWWMRGVMLAIVGFSYSALAIWIIYPTPLTTSSNEKRNEIPVSPAPVQQPHPRSASKPPELSKVKPEKARPKQAALPVAPARRVMDGNIYENQPSKLTVQDPGTTFTHNTVRGMDADIKSGAYAGNNEFEGKGVHSDDPDNALKAAIRAARRANIYECPGPCGDRGPYPDVPLGLPPDLPLAKALRGSSRAVADQLRGLVIEGNALVDSFEADKDAEQFKKGCMTWESKVEKVISNLDPRLSSAFEHLASP